MRANDHLSPTHLAAFVAGGLSGETHKEAEAHLSTCRACRRLLVAAHDSSTVSPDVPQVPVAIGEQVRRLVPKQRARPLPIERSRPLWPSLLAAAFVAATLAGWLVLRSDQQSLSPPSRVVRSGTALSLAPALIEPVSGSHVADAVGLFRWSPVPDAGGYTVTVLDSRGDIVHESRTEETQLALELEPLATSGAPIPGTPYYWFVCAHPADGGEACSAVGRFVVE